MTTATLPVHAPHADPLPVAVVSPSALPADRNPLLVYLARLGSENSRRAMRVQLERMAQVISRGRHTAHSLPWDELGYPHTQALRTWLSEHGAPSTANLALSALRGVLRECWRLGYTTQEQYARAADLAPIKGERLPAGRALPTNELRTLFGACRADASPAGARDGALFAVMYGCALRRSEVVALDRTDYDAETGALTVRRAKGNKQRLVFVPDGGGRAALAAWLRLRGDAPGALFWPISQTGELVPRRFTAQVCRWALRKRAAEAGITNLPAPHDMRRSAISDMLDGGADLSVVQRVAGHSSPLVTSRYDRRGDAAKQRAADLLRVPW